MSPSGLDTGCAPSSSPLASSLRQSPWLCADDLAFTIGPEVGAESNELVNGSVRPLVEQSGGQGAEREEGQAGLETSVDAGAGEEAQRPLPGEEDDAKDQINDLQYRHWLDYRVKGLGHKVPKDLGPEEARERGSNLISCRRQDDEPRPVVLDELSHDVGLRNNKSRRD